uniref:Uncharacterized protein n=1 Tax=Panagrellus redivivus TaxID=6233 RepID=A0A7E4VGB6_PANRE
MQSRNNPKAAGWWMQDKDSSFVIVIGTSGDYMGPDHYDRNIPHKSLPRIHDNCHPIPQQQRRRRNSRVTNQITFIRALEPPLLWRSPRVVHHRDRQAVIGVVGDRTQSAPRPLARDRISLKVEDKHTNIKRIIKSV